MIMLFLQKGTLAYVYILQHLNLNSIEISKNQKKVKIRKVFLEFEKF